MNRKIHYLISTIILAFSAFFINYYLSQKLSVEDYGEFSLLFAFFSILSSITLFGQATSLSVVYFSDEKKGYTNINEELNHSYIVMLYAYLITCIALIFYWYFFDNTRSLFFVLLFCIALFFMTSKAFFVSLITLFDEYKKYLLMSVLMLFSTSALIYIQPNLYGFLYGIILSGIIAVIFGIKLHSNNHKTEQIAKKIFTKQELILLGWIAIPGMILSSINIYLDRYIINYFYNLEEVGYYSLAATLSVGIGSVFVTALIKGTIISTLQALQEKDVKKYIHIQNENIKVFLYLSAFSFMVYYFFGEKIILFVFGEKYALSIPYMFALFNYVLMNGISQVIGQSLVQQKKLYILFYISIFTVSLNLLLSILFNFSFGIKGIIIALLISGFINNYIIYFYSKKYLEFIKLPYFVLSFIMFLGILSLVIK